jgi:hypothetical protein
LLSICSLALYLLSSVCFLFSGLFYSLYITHPYSSLSLESLINLSGIQLALRSYMSPLAPLALLPICHPNDCHADDWSLHAAASDRALLSDFIYLC